MKYISLDDFIDRDIEQNELEQYLSRTMTTVEPSVGFVYGLKMKIYGAKSKGFSRSNVLKYGLFGTAGVISSVILVATSVKAVITVLGAIRLFRQVDGKLQKDQIAPVHQSI